MNFRLSEKTYDLLRWITLVLLPALSTLYLALSTVWSLPYANEVVSTVAAIVTFLGALLGISTAQYREQFPSFFKRAVFEANWVLSNEAYDTLKWITQIALPALATLYFTIAGVWMLPYSDQVVATIMAIVTFLGAVLQFSTSQFNKAYMETNRPR